MTPREQLVLKWGAANAVFSFLAAAVAIATIDMLTQGTSVWILLTQAAAAAFGTSQVHRWVLRQARAELAQMESLGQAA